MRLHLQSSREVLLTCLQVERRDAGDPAGWESTSELTFILMMEVLDNCPHDRVHKPQSSGAWQQTHVLEDAFEVIRMTRSLSLLQLPNQGTETMLPVK